MSKTENFNSLYGWLNDTYLINLLKEIDWSFNNIFSPEDKDQILNAVVTSETKAHGIANNGRTKETASELGDGMWIALNETITGKSGITLENYFENIYKKLACCTNQKEIVVPILKQNSDGSIEKVDKRLSFDIGNTGQCKINGRDWYDDNQTKAGYNSKCEELMTRLIAFLDKYDPENKMLETYGGCMANVNLPKNNDIDSREDPIIMNLINRNRTCFLNTCNAPEAYKRQNDREPCQTAICNAKIDFSGLDAIDSVVNLLGNSIEQNCGVNSEISKKLEAIQQENVNQEENITDESIEKVYDETADKVAEITDKINQKNETVEPEKEQTLFSWFFNDEETTTSTEETPGFFTRFFNWLASLFNLQNEETETFKNIDIKNMDKRIKLLIICFLIFGIYILLFKKSFVKKIFKQIIVKIKQ